MGQYESYIFLKENKGKWFSSREISEGASKSMRNIIPGLKKLTRWRLILRKHGYNKRYYIYSYKPKKNG